ncbi:MAG: hydrolase [Sphingomonas sp. SCN 67-18]|uniref:quinoprotein relay system zinc metallohydrolase 1 n=1 Tax=uncultured Sphingomonas sp. TaxID=158754 RepID=UPI00086F9799|nr:quinoprotein relay system zinc metallohydrolase 1 [Sphingomonas sp. SCN 67-18]ODU20161.1 MAG: hydrolase [Sphingomonas sp. SCN 67-18]
MIDRRGMIAGLAAGLAAPALGADYRYVLKPQPIGPGVWTFRGADAPILAANGGAIANIGLIDTPAGAVLVDAGPSLRYGAALKKAAEAVTRKRVARVYITHVHPDHLYGAGAFDPAIVAAPPALVAAIRRDGPGFADGMYRLLGDWMRGTEPPVPGRIIDAGHEDFGGRRLRLVPLAGHSGADIAVLDEMSGVLIAGDLVFNGRAPSTPDASLAGWRAALDGLDRIDHKAVLPGHGPFDPTPGAAIAFTRDWIDWLERALTDAANSGLDMVEAGNIPLPPRFADVPAARYELQRSVVHFYPGIESAALPRIDAGR